MSSRHRRTDSFSGALPLARYLAVRSASEQQCVGLEPEDYQLQPMPAASPVKWHLAHTTWFFETFLLAPHRPGYKSFHPRFGALFGATSDTADRGLLSRPTVREVYAYRKHVDDAVADLLANQSDDLPPAVRDVLELGLNREQQHQEWTLTDLKYAFSRNPLAPAFAPWKPVPADAVVPPVQWVEFLGGKTGIGHAGRGFAFDNEGPRHPVLLLPYSLASRLVTAGEYVGFIADGGYDRPEFWLADGWAARQLYGWEAPLYWRRTAGGRWDQFTLAGVRPVDDREPVAHVSFYEADAYARWAGGRLPTESEWEAAAADLPPGRGNYAADRVYHPTVVGVGDTGLSQLFGDCWEWTASPFTAYPGYRPAGDTDKLMCNRAVLRGGSCATPRGHARATSRHALRPDARWHFSGVRLARD